MRCRRVDTRRHAGNPPFNLSPSISACCAGKRRRAGTPTWPTMPDWWVGVCVWLSVGPGLCVCSVLLLGCGGGSAVWRACVLFARVICRRRAGRRGGAWEGGVVFPARVAATAHLWRGGWLFVHSGLLPVCASLILRNSLILLTRIAGGVLVVGALMCGSNDERCMLRAQHRLSLVVCACAGPRHCVRETPCKQAGVCVTRAM